MVVKNMNKKIMIRKLFIIGIVAAVIIGWQIRTFIYQPRIIGDENSIIINRGDSTAIVAYNLAKSGIIDKPLLFKVMARISGLDKHLKAGEYIFESPISMYQIIQKIANGEVSYRKITLPEGLTSKQMLEVIANEEMLAGEITLEVEEGELLPETYSFIRGDSKNSVILQAKRAITKTLDEAWDNRQEDLPLKTKDELLILASIIEKETRIENERGLVASVFINRLVKGIKLQTDPTVIYALTQGKTDLNRRLTKKDLTIDSPYNTYKYYGLPPKPICNPGRASIKAAANPEYSDYLFFVADGKGGHNFATSLTEHNNNVKKWKNSKK